MIWKLWVFLGSNSHQFFLVTSFALNSQCFEKGAQNYGNTQASDCTVATRLLLDSILLQLKGERMLFLAITRNNGQFFVPIVEDK